MKDENETYRSEEIIEIKNEIKEQLNELFDNIPFLLYQINELINYSNEKAEKRSENFFNKIIKELDGINQKIINFNIYKFENSDIIEKKENSYSNLNNISFNSNNLSNNNISKAKDFYGSFYKSFEVVNSCLSSNKISLNNNNNNIDNNNDLNIIYSPSFLLNFNEDCITSFLEAEINIFNKLNIFLHSKKINQNYFKCFLEGINKLIMNLDDKNDVLSDCNIFSSIEEIENKSTNSSICSDANIKVQSIQQLENNKNNSHCIVSISLCEEKLKSISIFNDYELSSLKKLELKGNYIKDITPLLNSSLHLLEYLDLEDNEIDNKCIDVLKNVKMDFLFHLNLFKNKITTIKIFEISENLKSLELLYLGYNYFSEDEIKKK